MSLIELTVVITIIGVLAGLGVVNFTRWINRYKVETEAKQMYTDLMQARLMAMEKNRVHFVNLAANSYSIYDDTNGDGALTVGTDPLAYPATSLSFPIAWNGTTPITFNTKGLTDSSAGNTICIYSTLDPSYDCVVVSRTRIRAGKLNSQGGTCSSDKCDAK